MKKILFFIVVFLLLENISFAQPGCTDPQATNYDSNATSNDGSCQYPSTSYMLNEIAILPTFFNENSGLAFYDDKLWTHNDGGGEDKIYEMDTVTGGFVQSIVIAAAENTDWEDLAEDEQHIYIGDFGNNDGDRTDLKIYKIKKSQISSGVATAETIEFSYSDQTNFTTAHHANDFDCEAFFYHNDSLHLFSKNWLNQKTRHYVLPTNPGNHVAELRDSLNVQGLITSADINDDGVIVLLGYDLSGVNFMWLCFDYQGMNFFSGNKRKISLGLALVNSQTEAIVFRENGYGYISAEAFATLDAKLHSFDISEWIENIPVSNENFNLEKSISVFPNPTSDIINIDFKNILLEDKVEIELYNSQGQFLINKKQSSGRVVQLDISNQESGFYFIKIKTQNQGEFLIKKITKP